LGSGPVIILDTHVWVWWVHQDDRLPTKARSFIAQHEIRHIGISAISCWEVTNLVERGRLRLPLPTDQWLHAALDTRVLGGGISVRGGRGIYLLESHASRLAQARMLARHPCR
jgi:hypothetical protein